MNLSTYLVRRLAGLIPVVLGVTLIVFLLIRLIPGDPARTMLGVHATPAAINALHHQWGLDRPVILQYGQFMSRLMHGNLGDSLYYDEPVTSLVAARMPATLLLLVLATLMALLIAVPLAALAATHKDKLVDQMVRFLPLIGLGFPQFWVGIILILVVALHSGGVLPVAGFGDTPVEHLRSMVLPSLTIAISMAPILIRSLRTSLLDVLESEYIVTARSKGIPERRVMTRHALRNAVVSSVTVLGVNIGWLVGGTLVVEQVFGLPGVGSLMISSVFQRDFPIVQGVTLVLAVLVILVYLATDVAYALLDPRVRFD